MVRMAKITNPFVRARQARRSELAEDYVELIADLIAREGEARAASIARVLGVTQATVTNTIARLVRDGFVKTEPYRPIELTARGRALAEHSRQRHSIVRNFLLSIGVRPETATIDAEGIEHHVSAETLSALRALTHRLLDPKSAPEKGI